jgi:endogenous inhibitor of DNA gyrase (YacG/DUF329 family)
MCRARPVEARWRPFCSQRCQLQDQARWADGSYRVDSPSSIEDAEDAEARDADDDDG